VRHVAHVEPRPAGQAWLVERLFGRGAVGFAAGPPKLGKTWICCELALAVATGTPALGHFAVPTSGTVVFYGAEDDQPSLRSRFEGIASLSVGQRHRVTVAGRREMQPFRK
jgi:RecA-family ATPase